jgi:hypothetical protein
MRSGRTTPARRQVTGAAGDSADSKPQPKPDREVDSRIGVLNALSAQQLREEWRRLYRAQPPRLSRDLLVRSLAYRIQELTSGGLNKATQRLLANLGREMAAKGAISVAAQVNVRPGTRLIREWRGKTHAVLVLDDGFAFEGKTYPSLTRIAHLITGAHWSGPRFFGLNRKPSPGAGVPSEVDGFASAREAAHG